jgi:hypothetical protein
MVFSHGRVNPEVSYPLHVEAISRQLSAIRLIRIECFSASIHALRSYGVVELDGYFIIDGIPSSQAES